MSGHDNSKNPTFVEVIIVVLVCLFLLAMVPPVFHKTRGDASRITCKRNLSLIGKAMIIYANDYDDELPRAGGRNSMWSMVIPNWKAYNRYAAYGLSADGRGGQATITSSFYLLVKYAEVSPRTFICPGDSGVTEFNPSEYGAGDGELIDFWDFGPMPPKHCSYSYHMPYGLFTLSTSSEPGMAVAADRNPWISSSAAGSKNVELLSSYNPDGSREAVKIGNTTVHQGEGQNVLFVDGHVSFEKSPCCGIENDNIYTFRAPGLDKRIGAYPLPYASEPGDVSDSYLVNESSVYRKKVTKEVKAVDSVKLRKTSIVATLDCPMPKNKNVIWCSTFQIAWDKLKNDIIGEPVKVSGAEELAARLNQAKASEADIEKESFYSAAGFVNKGIVKQIQKEMNNRFPSTMTDFDKSKKSLGSVVLYSFSNIDLEFKSPFYVENNPFIFKDSEGTHTEIKSFTNKSDGFGDTKSKYINEQIEIMYYKRENRTERMELAIDLCKHTNPYQVIIALVSRGDTLRETLTAVEQKISEFKKEPNYEVLRKLRTFGLADIVTIPDILYKLTHQFEELKEKRLGNSQFTNCSFSEAKQIIDISLGKTSVKFKSDVTSFLWPLAKPPAKPRHFYFNKPFLIYVKKRQGGTDPFFVMWVDNAELMQEFESK